LNAAAKQVSTLHAVYTYSDLGGPARHNMVTNDFVGNRIDAIAMFPPEVSPSQPAVHRWITDGHNTWTGILRPAAPDVIPGSWQIQRFGEGDQVPQPDMSTHEFGHELLKAAVVPYHILKRARLTSQPLPEGMSLKIDNWSKRDRTYRAYRILQNGLVVTEILYEMDISDGLRILSTTCSAQMGSKLVPIYVLNLDNFKKISDVWFPFKITETLYDTDLKPYHPNTITVHSVDMNMVLTDAAFSFVPTNGSIVEDVRTEKVTIVDYRLPKQVLEKQHR